MSQSGHKLDEKLDECMKLGIAKEHQLIDSKPIFECKKMFCGHQLAFGGSVFCKLSPLFEKNSNDFSG